METKVVVPSEGQKITLDANCKLMVPSHPIIPFIEGDGIGVDVTPAMIKVVDAAVAPRAEQDDLRFDARLAEHREQARRLVLAVAEAARDDL